MRIRVAGAPIVQAIITLWILAILAGGARAQTTQIWTVPEVGALPYDANGLLVRRGRDLITATYAYIGPNVPDVPQRYAGNNLACSNCHLSAGVRKFALPLFGLYGEFPQYSPRSATEITIEDRINSCMTRSMNGQPLPPAAAEMQAIAAYIKFLSSGVRRASSCQGSALERCRSCRAPPIQSAATRSTRADAPIATTLMGRACAAASPLPTSDT